MFDDEELFEEEVQQDVDTDLPDEEIDLENPVSDYDDFFDGKEGDVTDPSVEKTLDNVDFVNEVLKSKGFSDPNKIVIYDEDGDPQEVKFSDLSDADKLDLLTAPDTVLSDEEINTINFLRNNNITLKQYVDGQIKNALANKQSVAVSDPVVDNASDEELYIADLKYKFPNLTEDEIEDELDRAMDDQASFKKKVEVIRQQWKEYEKQVSEAEAQKVQQEKAAEREGIMNSLIGAAQDVDTLHGLDLEDEDKDEVLRFLLDEDVNGQSEFIKLLDDPKSLFKLAWYAKKGEEAIDMIHRYYRKLIETTRRKYKNDSRTSVVTKKSDKSNIDDRYDLSDIF